MKTQYQKGSATGVAVLVIVAILLLSAFLFYRNQGDVGAVPIDVINGNSYTEESANLSSSTSSIGDSDTVETPVATTSLAE